MTNTNHKTLKQLFNVGVEAVSGACSVLNHFALNEIPRPNAILSVGKAACSMYQGIPDEFKDGVETLIVTKDNHTPVELMNIKRLRVIESSHPIPSQKSLDAGLEVLNFVSGLPTEARLLLLVSGGASALVEVLKDDFSLNQMAALTDDCLSKGMDIATINNKRADYSLVKQGGLLSNFSGCHVDVLAISHVETDDINIIGSGIGAAVSPKSTYHSHIVASNKLARNTLVKHAEKLGVPIVINDETLYGDFIQVAKTINQTVSTGPKGLYVFGGEPTVKLPENPGTGGRNQALALLLAKYFSGNDNITCLVAGTDGTDGPTNAAGAIIDGNTYNSPEADIALTKANSGEYLDKENSLLITGPTGTNVMDIALILKT